MDINKKLRPFCRKEKIVDMLARYELYYQIGLGNYVFETIQDIEETIKKLNELDLHFESYTALSNIFEIILHNLENNDFEEKFEYLLRKRALMHSLKDFVNNDDDLLNVDDYIKQKSKDIIDDIFFTENMKDQFESEYLKVYTQYEILITDEIIRKIQEHLN